MLAVHDLEIRVGARVLMSDVSFRVSNGDKVILNPKVGLTDGSRVRVRADDAAGSP